MSAAEANGMPLVLDKPRYSSGTTRKSQGFTKMITVHSDEDTC